MAYEVVAGARQTRYRPKIQRDESNEHHICIMQAPKSYKNKK